MAPTDPDEPKAVDKLADCKNAMSPLMREVGATHLFAWSASGGGPLVSMKIPTTDVAQQIRTAVRLLEKSLDDATKMVQSASNQFDNAVRRWESQVQQAEQKMRQERATGKLSQAKAKHNGVKTRISPVQGLFRSACLALRTAGL
jgi:hypothetical protein